MTEPEKILPKTEKPANTLRKKKKRTASPSIGLKNLDERFKITTGLPIKSGLEGEKFKVLLPMVTVKSDERAFHPK